MGSTSDRTGAILGLILPFVCTSVVCVVVSEKARESLDDLDLYENECLL